MRKNFPADFSGYGLAARELSKEGRADEAEKLLAQGVRFVQDDAGAAIEYARLPMARQDWAAGIERWRVVSERFNHPAGAVSMAECLRKLGRFDEAEATLNEAQPRFPLEPAIRAELARVAEARGNTEEALKLWDQVRQRFPMVPSGHIETFRILRSLGREADAEGVKAAALDRFPDLSF